MSDFSRALQLGARYLGINWLVVFYVDDKVGFPVRFSIDLWMQFTHDISVFDPVFFWWTLLTFDQ